MEEESKLSKMKLIDIFKIIDMKYLDIDISFFCDDEQVIDKFEIFTRKNIGYEELLSFFIENEEKIDKEKLVLYIYTKSNETRKQFIQKMYKDFLGLEGSIDIKKILGTNLKIKSIEDFQKHILQNKTRKDKLFGMLDLIAKNNKQDLLVIEKIKDLLGDNRAIKYFEKQIINCEELLKDVDINIIKIGDNGKKIILDITNSQEEIQMQKKERRGDTKKSNKVCPELARINKIAKQISSDRNGLNYIVQCVLLDDLFVFVKDETIASNIREIVALNSLIKDEKYTIDNIASIKDFDQNTYTKLVNSISTQSYIKELSDAIKQYAKFIDVDKLLMVALYRFKEIMEQRELTGEKYHIYKYLYSFIKDKIENKELLIKIEPKEKSDEEIWFSYKDIEELMKFLLEDRYVSKKELRTIRDDILSGERQVQDTSIEMLKVLEFSDDELEIIMNNSVENTIYLTELAKLKEDAIYSLLFSKDSMREELLLYFIQNKKISLDSVISLYLNNKIDLEFLKDHTDELDLSSEITLSKINQEYLGQKKYKGKDKEEKIEKLDAKIDIYKAINLEKKTDDEFEELSNEVIYEIAEDFEDDEDILFYYNRGLITLETVAEWSGEGIIDRLYSDSQINISQIEDLYLKEKVSQKFIENIILRTQMDTDEIVEYMKKGYLSEETIVKIFEERSIYRIEAEELLKRGIISNTAYRIIENRDLEVLKEKAGAGFKGKLQEVSDLEMPTMNGVKISLPKISNKSDLREKKKEREPSKPSGGGKTHKLINPFIRLEYLKLLNCREPEDVDYDEMDKNNPFYDYNFFIIQEECLGNEPLRDAIVVAERFYTERETKQDFAMDNATYVMRFEDYLILQGKQRELKHEQKREMVKEVPGAIYIVSHRDGSWAMSLIKAIAKAKAGSNFEKLTPNQRRREVIDWLHTLYTSEELNDILDFGGEIDDGKHTYVEKNGKFVKTTNYGNIEDDSEQR